MQTFYFPGAKNLFFPVNASVATRAGFLFADAVIQSPQTILMIDMDAPLCVVSTEMKLQSVLPYFDEIAPEHAASLRENTRLTKAIRAQKHKNKQQIIALRKYEDFLDVFYRIYIDHMTKAMEPFGLPELKGILDDPAMQKMYNYNETYPENPLKGGMSFSDLLLMKGDAADQQAGVEDVAFILPADFFDPASSPAGLCSLSDYLLKEETTPAEEAIWLAPLVSFPFINYLSALELRAVRHQMQEPGCAFRQAVDVWISDSLHERRTARERALFVSETLLPTVAPLQEAIRQNKNFSAHQVMEIPENQEPFMQLFAAEIPLQVLWAFYEKAGMIPEPTLEKLRGVWDTAGRKRYPVFIIGPLGDTDTAIARAAELAQAAQAEGAGEDAASAAPVSVRKRIELD